MLHIWHSALTHQFLFSHVPNAVVNAILRAWVFPDTESETKFQMIVINLEGTASVCRGQGHGPSKRWQLVNSVKNQAITVGDWSLNLERPGKLYRTHALHLSNLRVKQAEATTSINHQLTPASLRHTFSNYFWSPCVHAK